MSFATRFRIFQQTISNKLSNFQTVRFLDIGEKGKAEENAYFKKEQARLLEKLRDAIKSAANTFSQGVSPSPKDSNTKKEKKDENNK